MTKNINAVNEEEKVDIIELKNKIIDFTLGVLPEEKFNHYRLTRGVYGQRQTGSQMIRIKIPYGRLNSDQLIQIANTSDKYANGNCHITTRQNIQYHYVKLNNSPKVWDELSSVGLTLREACGNTVRNVTGSAIAGIDPDELFDVSPYIDAVFEYFLRNPICQDLGRKIKIAFSSSESDSAFTYFNDLGFIPKMSSNKRGFKVVVGGGLGAQSIVAQTAYEFLEENKVIPFIEATLRVFDRYGERNNRNKARLKYFVKRIGLSSFMELVSSEMKANKNKEFQITLTDQILPKLPQIFNSNKTEKYNKQEYNLWKKTNVFKQKQKGFYGIKVKVSLGDLSSDNARGLASIVKKYADDDIRLTINQGFIIKYVRKENLVEIFCLLASLKLVDPGFDSTYDITTCPGTDTCNLGITNSTALTKELENIVIMEFPELLEEKFLKIKISGCMNSCGQHMVANIGFHGSSRKVGNNILPVMQLVLGGGINPDGKGLIADKIKKIPTKRVPELLRILLSDFEENGLDGEYYNAYYKRLGINYFSTLVQPLANTTNLKPSDYIDWGKSDKYVKKIGIGECAGVSYDVVSLIIDDTKNKLKLAEESLNDDNFADSLYHSYSVFINGAKSMLLANDIRCNTQVGIIKDFQLYQEEKFNKTIFNNMSFEEKVLQINKNKPTKEFAEKYFQEASRFLSSILSERET